MHLALFLSLSPSLSLSLSLSLCLSLSLALSLSLTLSLSLPLIGKILFSVRPFSSVACRAEAILEGLKQKDNM